MHDLLCRLAGCFAEQSPKALRKQNAENVLVVLVHGSVDGCHPFPDHHHLRSLMGSDENRIVVRVQGEEFNAVVLPSIVGDGFGGVVFFHGEAAAAFRVPHGIELDEDDAALAGACRAEAEEVPGAVLDLRLHRVAADAGDEHAGFDGGPGGFGPADFLRGAFRSPEAGGGFEAVDGDEAGEFFLGGGGLDEAGELVGFGLVAFPGVGAGVHDSQGSGDGDGFDGPAGFGLGEGNLVVGAGSSGVFAEPAAEEREDLVILAAERRGDVAGDLDELEHPLAAIGKDGCRRADGAAGQFRDGGEPQDGFAAGMADLGEEAADAEFGSFLDAGLRVVGEAVVHQLCGHRFEVGPEIFRARKGGEEAVALALEPMPTGLWVHPLSKWHLKPPLGPLLERSVGVVGKLLVRRKVVPERRVGKEELTAGGGE